MSSTVAIGVSIETTERPPVPGVVPVSRTLVDYALHYAQLGFLALPVHGFSKGNCTCGQAPCRSPGKHPVTSNGATGASADPTTFAAWFGAYSVGERNIGIRVCERHFVIDVDSSYDKKTGKDKVRRCARLGSIRRLRTTR
jgi:Bifunctional DNA primase/polymerase, N-terminal